MDFSPNCRFYYENVILSLHLLVFCAFLLRVLFSLSALNLLLLSRKHRQKALFIYTSKTLFLHLKCEANTCKCFVDFLAEGSKLLLCESSLGREEGEANGDS